MKRALAQQLRPGTKTSCLIGVQCEYKKDSGLNYNIFNNNKAHCFALVYSVVQLASIPTARVTTTKMPYQCLAFVFRWLRRLSLMLVLAACYTAGLHGALLPFYSQFNAELAKCATCSMCSISWSTCTVFRVCTGA